MPTLSFRQVGRAATTDTHPTMSQPLRQQRHNEATADPSIPSKFAKIPYSPTAKAKSFGTSAARFDRNSSAPNPGPGYYLTDRTIHALIDRKESTSQRGFGGFASKSDRFTRMQLDKINFPAPGQYNSASGPAADSFDGGRRAVTAASFRSRTARCDYMDATRTDAPAPGTYELASHKHRKEKVSASSFKSGTKRSSYIEELQRDSPAPGAYDPKVPADFRKDAIRYAAFRMTGPRLPEWGTPVPGPGEYNPKHPAMGVDGSRAGGGGGGGAGGPLGASSSFANTNTDRWGAPYERKVALADPNPGPGAYAAAYMKQKPQKVTSSWAKSAALRGLQRPKHQPPGPSYYNPDRPSKQSFHHNASGSFT